MENLEKERRVTRIKATKAIKKAISYHEKIIQKYKEILKKLDKEKFST